MTQATNAAKRRNKRKTAVVRAWQRIYNSVTTSKTLAYRLISDELGYSESTIRTDLKEAGLL